MDNGTGHAELQGCDTRDVPLQAAVEKYIASTGVTTGLLENQMAALSLCCLSNGAACAEAKRAQHRAQEELQAQTSEGIAGILSTTDEGCIY